MHHTRIISTILYGICLTGFYACSSSEIGESKDVAQDKIYQDYNINYFEKNNELSLFAQFRFAGSNGTTLVLSKPSQISFDENLLSVDSTTGRGSFYFYTPEKSIDNLYGKHHFIFTDINNKKFDNDFSFDTFKLVNVPASVSKKQAFSLSFETSPLLANDYIEISTSNTDSSFSITAVNSTLNNGNIIIPAKELQRQKVSTLVMDITLYRKIPLQQTTPEGGEMRLRYSLKPVKIRLNE